MTVSEMGKILKKTRNNGLVRFDVRRMELELGLCGPKNQSAHGIVCRGASAYLGSGGAKVGMMNWR